MDENILGDKSHRMEDRVAKRRAKMNRSSKVRSAGAEMLDGIVEFEEMRRAENQRLSKAIDNFAAAVAAGYEKHFQQEAKKQLKKIDAMNSANRAVKKLKASVGVK